MKHVSFMRILADNPEALPCRLSFSPFSLVLIVSPQRRRDFLSFHLSFPTTKTRQCRCCSWPFQMSPSACFGGSGEVREMMGPMHVVLQLLHRRDINLVLCSILLRSLTARNLQSIEMRNLGAPEVSHFKPHYPPVPANSGTTRPSI